MSTGRLAFTFLLLLALTPLFEVAVKAGDLMVVQPGQSIQEAINKAKPGEWIFISKGIYYESSIIINKPLTITGAGTESTIIDGSATSSTIFIINSPNVRIAMLTIRNTSKSAPTGWPAGLYISNSYNVTIERVAVKQTCIGIQISNSSFNTFLENRIAENYYAGIRLSSNSNKNTILGNDIKNNNVGLIIADGTCQWNKIYHNNFINNTIQAQHFGGQNTWDDGYPSGGNFWSDHQAEDVKSGPNQTDTGGDGILDTPYPDAYSKWDRYPLSAPMRNILIEWQGSKFQVKVISNASSIQLSFDQQAKSLYLNFSRNQKVGFCRVAIPKNLLWCQKANEWSIIYSHNNQTIQYNIQEDNEETYLYFTFSPEIGNIIRITATNAIPEFQNVYLQVLLFILTSILLVVSMRSLSGHARKKDR